MFTQVNKSQLNSPISYGEYHSTDNLRNEENIKQSIRNILNSRESALSDFYDQSKLCFKYK